MMRINLPLEVTTTNYLFGQLLAVSHFKDFLIIKQPLKLLIGVHFTEVFLPLEEVLLINA